MTVTIAFPDGTSREATPEDLLEIERRQKLADAEMLEGRKQAARFERSQLLSVCDWTQAVDVPQAIKDKWAAYRQTLRDVPQQAGFPENIQWPSKPE
jgi:hypothetical protein